jgi:hypothetical protein
MARKDANPGKDAAASERRIKVLELRKSGASFRTIADHLAAQGVEGCSLTQVHKDYKRAMKDLSEVEMKLAKENRQLELHRLDALWLAHWAAGLRGDIASGWLLLAIHRRRCELEGYDAPKQHDVKVNAREALAALLGVPEEKLPQPKTNASNS